MKFIHTSDWHLGKKLGSFSRLPEQKEVLDEICTIAENNAVDAVVIAGDVFDTYNPPVEAIELYYKTLYRLSRNGACAVIAVAGNHDSPDRIISSDPLARQLGIIQTGYAQSIVGNGIKTDAFAVTATIPGAIEIDFGGKGKLNVILSAFANEQRFNATIEGGSAGNQLSAFWNNVIVDLNIENFTLLVSHALFFGNTGEGKAEEPEGEKPIEFISEQMFPESVPAGVDYVALGHLHRMQMVSDLHCPITYSGSPLAYSFSETNQSKYVIVGDTESKQFTPKELNAGKKLKRHSFNSVETACAWLQEQADCWVELVMKTTEFLQPEQIALLKAEHSGIVSIIPEVLHENNSAAAPSIDLTKSRTELFTEYFEAKKGTAPPKDILNIFNEMISTDD